MENNGAKAIWRVVEKVILVLVIGLAGWMFTSINALQERVARIEMNKQENVAQWAILKEHGEKVQDCQIELEVYTRMFQMLLEQNKIKVEKLNLPSPPPIGKRSIEDFRKEQMQIHRERLQKGK